LNDVELHKGISTRLQNQFERLSKEDKSNVLSFDDFTRLEHSKYINADRISIFVCL